MKQLWLSGNRIDSITFLRGCFAQSDVAAVPLLCGKMLAYYRSGALAEWLQRQPELYATPAIQNLQDNPDVFKRLLAPADEPMRERQWLADLCGVPTEAFDMPAALDYIGEAAKRDRLMRQRWWDAQSELRFKTVRDWMLVALESRQVPDAVERVAELCQEQGVHQQTIYLCNTGSPFVLNLNGMCRHIRFLGCGEPRVNLYSPLNGTSVDMQAQDLSFESFDLYGAEGLQLLHREGRVNHFTIVGVNV